MKIGDYVRTEKGLIGKYNIVKAGETIPNFEGLYEVSNLGRVKALKRKKNCNRGWGWIKEHIMKQTTANSE